MPRDDDEALAQEREWQAIVENFGERAVLGPDDRPAAETEPAWASYDEGEERVAPDDAVPDDERFVPPTPPPLPRPSNDRLAAWLGVFGAPAILLVCVVAGIGVPGWAGLLLAASFVGGFLYLVLRLPDTPRDPWDDGAVL